MKLEVITIISLAISITVGILSNKLLMGSKRGKHKFLEEAKKKGNVVQGILAGTKLLLGNEDSKNVRLKNDRIRATYHYTVKGKTYKKVMIFQSWGRVLPDYPASVQVYYNPSNPKKAVCPEEATESGRRQSGCLLSIVIGFVTMVIVFNVINALFG